MSEFMSYPRTPHMQGSGLQKGDDAKSVIPFRDLKGLHIVVEEKVDGANSGFSFDGAGERVLQSRGTILSHSKDVWRERHFNHLKTWTENNQDAFLERLEDRYIVYGEWMGAAHSVFYDDLPHLFLEFDIRDRTTDKFLSTNARRRLLEGLDICSVPVLYEGEIESEEHLRSMVTRSLFRTDEWQNSMRRACEMAGDNYDTRIARMFSKETSEGLYLKVEDGDHTIARMKWVEPGFVQTILDSNIHWQSTFVVPNMLGRFVPDFPPTLVRPDAQYREYNAAAPMAWLNNNPGTQP